MVERRLSKRMPFKSQIIYATSVGYSFNLSEGGIEIRGKSLLPPKSKIIVNVVVNDKIEEFIGSIVWTSETMPGTSPRMGIKFISNTSKLNLIYQQKIKEHKDTSV